MGYSEVKSSDLFGELDPLVGKHVPPTLWVRGHQSLLTDTGMVSIVGSRECSEDGVRRAKKLARILAEHGITVVSGLAKGIDTAAHTGAIEAGGSTIAVIGTPIDRAYPAENAALQEQIAIDHLLVSQFAPGRRVHPSNFPARNRTMAFIAHATVIIEAKDQSGTLHQGWEALRLSRPLFIAESAAQHPDARWVSEFVKYGAVLLSADTLDQLLEVVPSSSSSELSGAVPF